MTETLFWGTPIAWYLFLAGLSAGAYAAVALIALKNSKDTQRIQRVGRILAPVVLAVGLMLLMTDAKAGMLNPGRFFLLVSNLHSVMSWGVLILIIFGVISVVSAVLSLMKWPVSKWLDVLGLVFAFLTAIYTGVLIGVVKTYPLWNTALLPVLFAVSAFSVGLAAVFLGGTFFAHKELEKAEGLKRMRTFLPIAEGILIVLLLLVTSSANPAALESTQRLLSGDLSLAFWLGLVVIGLALPLVLELITYRSKASSGPSSAANIIGGAGALIGGFMLRYLIIYAAVPLVIAL
ncbi:MAG: polysulfide reductase NrfD [Coriobacteriales bacterium]|jgi:formate-dependent nitrite reductase membrane component NrfD|nr:polysulfide reductase NrfD [Coriobacteriales bacterium]